jgi:hypothetical protein
MPPESHFPEMVDADVPGDRVRPRREPRLVLELGRVVDDLDEHILHQIFRHLRRADMTQDKIENGGLVPPDKAPEGSPVAALKPHHQDLVGHLLA